MPKSVKMLSSTRIRKLGEELGHYKELKTLQCTLSGAADMLEGRVAIWWNLERLEEWADWNLTKFIKEK